jgi:hypothetical protein
MIMINDDGTPKGLRLVQLIQLICIAAIPVYWDVLNDSKGVIPKVIDGSAIPIVTGLLILFGLPTVLIGLMGPEWYLKRVKRQIFKNLVATTLVMRAGFFTAVAVYGFILGVIGVSWVFPLGFFVVAGILLVVTFPTKTRWEKMSSLAQDPK